MLAQAIRRHGSLANRWHWVLEVTFREEDSRVRNSTAALNFARLRQMTLNLAGLNRSGKASLRAKRKKGGLG